MNLIEFINSKRAYLDGAMGSLLIKKGFNSRQELLSIENPKVIAEITKEYLSSGSDIVLTNTFSANTAKADLSKYTLEEIILSAIKIAKNCVNDNQYALYDCGPSGQLLAPYGNTSFEEVYEIFAEQAKIVNGSGVDGVIIETFTDLQELRAAVLAFKEHTDLPIFCSMSFEKNGRTFLGVTVESFALTMQGLGVDALGINCGTGPEEMFANIERLQKYAHVPLFAKANAGLPIYKSGKTYYSLDAKSFALHMQKIASLGVNILGGCCGSDSEYIKELVLATKDMPYAIPNNFVDGVCSYAKVVQFDSKKTVVIGERVNPTNKPLLKEAIKNDDYSYILSMCLSQIKQGADILDINVGMAGINEAEKLKSTVTYLQGVADVPLCIDTSKLPALTDTLRIASGVCIINSVNGEETSMHSIFPLAKKYGSYIIALCLDKNGIPDNVDGRIAIAKKILDTAKTYGINSSKFLFDPLTMAVSVNNNNALLTLSTIKALHEELRVKTTLGLSNVSFGLPNRDKINSTFYELVRRLYSQSAIINPLTKPYLDEDAYLLLLGKDTNCENYIAKNSTATATEEVQNVDYDISYCIEHGYTNEGMDTLRKKADKDNFATIIDKEIIGGLNKLGDAYEKGLAFLPQLMAGSDTAKAMLDYIKANFMQDVTDDKATIVIATVKGDVHDIGKNIVKAVIGNYGYRVIDLGKDVPTEKIIIAINNYQPQVLALSALMTTTLDNMSDTILEVKKLFPDIIIVVGGAIVTADYAENLNVHYSSNAQEMVKKLEIIL